jgi:choline dehydrogenase
VKYHVVVVGAGSAGCPLAARLSEEADRNVLLIEAGPHYLNQDDYPKELLRANSAVSSTPGHPNNWSFMGKVSSKVSYPIPRGKVVGGSSAVNGTVFCRGIPDDYDGWAAEGNDEWSFDKVLSYFRKSETDHDFRDHYHGEFGPIPVRRPRAENLLPDQSAFMAACLDAGFARDEDKNNPASCGVGILPMNNIDGLRINAAMAYLVPAMARSNLTIMSNVFVRRVLFEGKTAIGVEAEKDGRTVILRGDEIVLSCGAIKSPHLLMLSGIGPADELSKAGIRILHDSPGVGKNFMDHPTVVVPYSLRKDWVDIPLQQLQTSLQFTASGSPWVYDLQINPCCINPFGTSTDKSSGVGLGGAIERFVKHPIRSLTALRGISMRRLASQIKQRNDLLLICSLQRPEGKGEIVLRSADPHTQPELNYNYFSNGFDRLRMREAVRLAARLLKHKAFVALDAKISAPGGSDLESDTALDEWLLGNVFTAVHTAGSCRMGSSSDETAVVDQYCRVRGVQKLRVVDCAIQPTAVRRGANATAIMIGERAADLMRLQV